MSTTNSLGSFLSEIFKKSKANSILSIIFAALNNRPRSITE